MARFFAHEETRVTDDALARSTTGRSARDGVVRTYRLGDRVSFSGWVESPDGGSLRKRFYGAIVRIGRGTEIGMHGLTTLVVIKDEDDGVERVYPARLLHP